MQKISLLAIQFANKELFRDKKIVAMFFYSHVSRGHEKNV